MQKAINKGSTVGRPRREVTGSTIRTSHDMPTADSIAVDSIPSLKVEPERTHSQSKSLKLGYLSVPSTRLNWEQMK